MYHIRKSHCQQFTSKYMTQAYHIL